MTTKERIIEEALTLFSIKGYKGTSVKNIAEAVGIKDSSLYKHFRSKQEIFDTIVEKMRGHISQLSLWMGLPEKPNREAEAKVFAGFGMDGIVELSKRVFLFYLTDSYISRFWKMATIEQFHDPEIYQVYRELFFNDSISYQSELFRELSRQGVLIPADPEVMAMAFFSPIFFLLSKYMGQPDKEEALRVLEKQVREFCRVYHTRERGERNEEGYDREARQGAVLL